MKLIFLVILIIIPIRIFAVTDEELKEKTAKPRWLSIPESRIVLNPTGISHTGALVPHLSQGSMASLNLNAGYYYGEYPERVPDIWSWRPVDAEYAEGSGETMFDALDLEYSEHGASLVRSGSELVITQTADKYGFIESRPVALDEHTDPLVFLHVDGSEEAQWAFKVGYEGEHDVNINTGCSEKGEFVFDLRNYLKGPWDKKIYFRIFTVGKVGTSVRVKNLSAGSISPRAEAFEQITQFWQPSQINTAAVSDTRKTSVKATVFFADTDSVVQRTIITEAGSDLIFQGVWNKGKLEHGNDVIILRHPNYSIVIATSKNTPVTIYKSLAGYFAGDIETDGEGSFWCARFGGLRKGDIINTSAVFVPGGEVTEAHIAKAKSLAGTPEVSKALQARTDLWDMLLSKVPVPFVFSLDTFSGEPDDVNNFSPEERYERMYYKAWAFLYQDLLPPMPENGYGFLQFACGKPSLWSEGHPKARASAQWESVIAMQFAGYVMPDEAWNALEGIISLADEDGSIGGEGLPSRHCQTAWILYSLTGDRDKLAELYPGMKRILLWKINDPRWIYKDLTPPGQKDIEFVTHDLTDLGYMLDICSKVKPEDKEFWEEVRRKLYKDFTGWFWKESGGDAYRIYHEGQQSPHNTWTLVALGLAKDILQAPEKESLLDLYREKLNMLIPLLLEGFSKHPSRQLLMRGLYWCDQYDDARLIAESTLNDITTAGEFAESYNNGGRIAPEGVIPSIFGVANIIDSCMWINNVWLSEGLPMIIPCSYGGVSNLLVKGKILNIFADESRVTISGEAALDLDKTGFTETEEGVWQKEYSQYEKISLQ